MLAIFYIVITHLSGHTTPECAVHGQLADREQFPPPSADNATLSRCYGAGVADSQSSTIMRTQYLLQTRLPRVATGGKLLARQQ